MSALEFQIESDVVNKFKNGKIDILKRMKDTDKYVPPHLRKPKCAHDKKYFESPNTIRCGVKQTVVEYLKMRQKKYD